MEKKIAWNSGSGNITLTYIGKGDESVSVVCDENNLGSERSQVISIQTTDGAITKNLTVKQAACPFPVNKVANYSYTGSVQQVTLPRGKYKLQCWGAQGGSNAAASSYSITAQAGGKGGYSEGVITLTETTTLYIFVGGQGGSSGNGGWNGGGGGSGSSTYNSGGEQGVSRMGCGGGATDIALVSSAMSYSSYRTNRTTASLLSRIIVAGGGSGGAMCYQSKQTTSIDYTLYGSYSVKSTEGVTDITDGRISNTFSSPLYYSDIYINKTTLKQGDIIRVTLGKTLNTNSYVRIGFRNSSTDYGWASYTDIGRSSQVSSFEYTIPSHTSTNVFNISVRCDDAYFGSSVKVEIKTTSTNTSTSNYNQTGYVGGGTNGAGYSSSYYGRQNAAGSGGAFGAGANMTTTGYRYCSACGGGGWYGGGSGYSDYSTTYVKYSGGGSGFVNTAANASYRPSNYTGLQLDSGTTTAGNASFESTSGGKETGHSGNGYARITRLE